jgi:hypothetical protein
MYPPAPSLQNTDGEDVVFHSLSFEIDSPRRAFDALKHLALDVPEDDLLEEAELDSDGEVRRVVFAWTVAGNAMHPSWENTVHGHIEIDGQELRSEVNSAERAAKLRGILEERLGDDIRHEHTEIESGEDAMSRGRAPSPASAASERPSWPDEPEVLDRIRELTTSHYESWVTEEIPALGGLTPLEAVRDRIGREKVEALITGMERSASRGDTPVDEGVLPRMRERLDLVRNPHQQGQHEAPRSD